MALSSTTKFLPRHVDLPLRRQIAAALIIQGQIPAAVDRQIEHPIRPAQGLAEFRMIQNGNHHRRQRRIVLIQHLTAKNRRPSRFNRAGRDAGLNRIAAAVEELVAAKVVVATVGSIGGATVSGAGGSGGKFSD